MAGIAHVITPDSASGAQIIDGSLKFDSNGSDRLERTPSSDGNRLTFTYSLWIKRGKFGEMVLLDARENDANRSRLLIDAVNRMQFFTRLSNNDHSLLANAVRRDPSNFYHFVWSVDTTQSTASERVKMYVNGELQSLTGTDYPDEDESTFFNKDVEHNIGAGQDSGGDEAFFDGSITQTYFIDGQALGPENFGFTDPLTNTWRPKKYEGTFGTNGFWLPMDNQDDFEKDRSGKGNNWTKNGFNGTSVDPDVLKDSPSGAVYGGPPTSGITTTSSPPSNYATLNPLTKGSRVTLSNGNLDVSSTASTGNASTMECVASIQTNSGKYYVEWTNISNRVANLANYAYGGTQFGVYSGGINNSLGGTTSGSGFSFTSSDVIALAVDFDNKIVYVYKNNSLQYTANYTTNVDLFFKDSVNSSGSSGTSSANFGQKPFKYAPPDGFLSLNSASVRPETVIPRPDQFVGVAKYTSGDGSAVSVNSYNFAPDLIFIKDRDGNNNWSVFDTVSGYANRLDTTGAGGYQDWSDYFGSFDLNGFTIKSATSDLNRDTNGMCSWCWKAGGNKNTFNVDNVGYSTFTTAPGLNSGTIDLTAASVGTKQGFSIVKWTGTGSAGTVPHALDNVPRVIIGKKNASENWQVYHHNSHATLSQRARLELNQRGKVATNDSYWNDTAPTSSVFSISNGYLNESGTSYIAYLWCDVPGLQKFGKYTGNATTNPFIELGFRPALLWIKNTSTTDTDWIIIDSQRQTSNLSTMTKMYINSSSSESTIGVDVQNNLDLLSNGFKLRDSNNRVNASNDVYIYFAWAEAPTVNLFGGQSNAR